MRLLISRVLRASLTVDNQLISSINHGMIVYVGFTITDNNSIVDKAVKKLVAMRIFEDSNNKMNRDVISVGGELMCVSNFTLYGRAERGNRPDYSLAARPEQAEPLYQYMLGRIRQYMPCGEGVFGADMKIDMVGDGPINIVVDYN